MNDPVGKPGLFLLGGGYLLNIVHDHISRADIFATGAFVCTCIGGVYYLLKIYNEFIKPKQKI